MTETGTSSTAQRRIVIGGKYEVYLDQPLGSGGLAKVYRGRDLRSRREVAIKTLRDEYRADPESRRRFRQEARMMAFASHPGLVTIYDLLEQANESWIVMEMVPGRNLKQIVEEDGPLPVEEVVRILEEASDALGHLHGRKIVHLDIKPQNLILTADGSLKLIDFGLAQSMAPRQDTVGGTAFGTAAYLSPEQGTADAVDQRTDVYALGCVVYELLVGQPPFVAPDGPDQKRQLIADHIDTDPVPPFHIRPELDLPYWVDGVVLRALAKSPDHRYQQVQDFAAAARASLEDSVEEEVGYTQELVTETPATPRIRFSPPSRSTRNDGESFDDDEEYEDDGFGPTAGRRAWMAGGRMARRTRPLHKTIWRLAMIFAIGNLLLASVMLIRGGPESLVERFLSVVPGTSTEVAVDRLNLRSGPGAEFEALAVLPMGQKVEVTGLSEVNDQGRWWPVQLVLDGVIYEGWVWGEGLQPNAWTGRMSFMQGVVECGQSIRDGVANGFDTVTGLWPF